MSRGQDLLNEWIWSGDQATGDAMRLIEETALQVARSCCGHRYSCEHAKPSDRTRFLRVVEERRKYGKGIRELKDAAHEVVMFWAKSETAAAASMEKDVLRLSAALEHLYELDHPKEARR